MVFLTVSEERTMVFFMVSGEMIMVFIASEECCFAICLALSTIVPCDLVCVGQGKVCPSFLWFSSAAMSVTSTSLLHRRLCLALYCLKGLMLGQLPWYSSKREKILSAQTSVRGIKLAMAGSRVRTESSSFFYWFNPQLLCVFMLFAEDGNHISQQDTQAKLRRQYFWAGMTYDVMRHIMACCMAEPLSAVPVEHRSPVIQQRVNKFRKYYKDGVSVSLVLRVVSWSQVTFSRYPGTSLFFFSFFFLDMNQTFCTGFPLCHRCHSSRLLIAMWIFSGWNSSIGLHPVSIAP